MTLKGVKGAWSRILSLLLVVTMCVTFPGVALAEPSGDDVPGGYSESGGGTVDPGREEDDDGTIGESLGYSSPYAGLTASELLALIEKGAMGEELLAILRELYTRADKFVKENGLAGLTLDSDVPLVHFATALQIMTEEQQASVFALVNNEEMANWEAMYWTYKSLDNFEGGYTPPLPNRAGSPLQTNAPVARARTFRTITSTENATLDKTISNTSDSDVFKISLDAAAKSEFVEHGKSYDIILVVDLSGSISSDGHTNNLKTATNGFIDAAKGNASNRIAIVTYNESAKINGANPSDSIRQQALVELTTAGVSRLKGIVGNFSPSGGTYPHYGLEEAYNIYEKIPSGGRERIVVHFTDGRPGTGNSIDCDEAQDSIFWGQTLKHTEGQTVPIDVNDTFYENFLGVKYHGNQFAEWKLFGGGWVKTDLAKRVTGRGATVYSVGLFKDGIDDGPEKGDGRKTNEYMYRVSSHVYDGRHESTGIPGYGYTNAVTMNKEGGYYLVVDDSNKLNELFKKISEQIGVTLTGIDVRDYITEYFDVVVPDGKGGYRAPTDGEAILSDQGVRGYVKKDSQGRSYIEWEDITLKPPSTPEADDAEDFSASIYIKRKDDFLGGKDVPTNLYDVSGIYNDKGEIQYKFPACDTDVPLKAIDIDDISEILLYGEAPTDYADADAALAAMILKYEDIKTAYNYQNLGVTFPAPTWDKTYPTGGQTEGGTYTLTATVSCEALTPKTATSTGTYTIQVVRPEFKGGKYTIWVGDTVKDVYDSVETIGNAVTLELPSGLQLTESQKTALEKRMNSDDYRSKFSYKIATDDYPLEKDGSDFGNYDPKADTTVAVTVKYGTSDPAPVYQEGVNVTIEVLSGSFTIQKKLEGSNGQQTQGGESATPVFIFKITHKQDDQVVRTFYATLAGGQSATFTGLTKGTYTVEELDTNVAYGNPVFKDGNSVTIDEKYTEHLTMTCTNTPKETTFWSAVADCLNSFRTNE